jgi:polyisoprenoid-binding protein YceI
MKPFLCALLASASLVAADRTIDLTPAATRIAWTLPDPLHTVRGTFQLKRGSITFDPETGKASGSIVVDVASGESGSNARDSRMHANVLESKKFPEAVFTPDHVEGQFALSGGSSVKLHGTFRIHGADHEITMDVQSNVASDQVTADATFDIPYVAWGMKDPSNFLLKVGKTVRMEIHSTARLKP